MTPITLIFAYYDNPLMLREQYLHVRNLPPAVRRELSLVVVDDGSPRHPAEAADLNGVPLQVYRIDVDVRWNQDAARNIGVTHCPTDWFLLTDVDHLVPHRTWVALLGKTWDRDVAYRFARVTAPEMTDYKPHPNSWFMSKRLYWRMGGYDERFAGYYGTDGDFRDRILQHGRIEQLKESLIRVPSSHVADAATTGYLRKQPEDRINIPRIKAERARVPGWRPLNLQFPHHRVFP